MLKIKSEILRRRQRRRLSIQSADVRRRHIAELFLLLLILISVHIGALVYFEGLGVQDAAWLTMTTVTTVGYGDLVAQTPGGRLATVLLLYIVGIFLLAQIAGEWIDYRFDRRDRMQRGHWRWKMKNHILILNTPDLHGARYLRMLVEQIRDTPLLDDIPIQVLSPHFPDGLPADIAGMGVALSSGKPEGRGDMAEVGVESAKFVVLLAVDTNDSRSDSVNLDMLDQLANYKLEGHVIAECVLESNRQRFRRLGADAVIRPIRAYPELMVRAMAAPGTEAILEDLFVYAGNHPRRYDLEFSHKPWGELAGSLLQQGLGTPLGYLDRDRKMITNPAPDAEVSGRALFLMVSQSAAYEPERVQACIDGAGGE
jgi:voltage-gated potassium channel